MPQTTSCRRSFFACSVSATATATTASSSRGSTGIARNLSADRFRDAKATIPMDGHDASADTTVPLDDIIHHEDHQQLERALAALPAMHREVLLLRGIEQLSHRDLATTLRCSEGAARVRVHRALAALKREWHATAGESR